ncbi:MAG: hypothetical protein OXG54_04250, partial [Gammaproteobacteria bacterium]|nr:hypothetical protein [Gammaproteobacteria bacterium]
MDRRWKAAGFLSRAAPAALQYLFAACLALGLAGGVAAQDDNGAEVAIVLSTATLAVTEGFAARFSVQLSSVPSSDVTLTVSGAPGTDLTVDAQPEKAGNQNTLTIIASNFDRAHSVTVSAGQDVDTANDTATLRLTAAGGDYAGLTADVTVNTDDDDHAPTAGLVLSPSRVFVDEGGSASYTVALATQPSGTVTVAITGHADTDLTLSPASLTFEPSDWNGAQPVTVSADKDDDEVNDTASLVHTASGGGYDAVSATQAVLVKDNDAGDGGALTIAPFAAWVNEGESARFVVTADPAPTAPLLLRIRATWTGDFSGSSSASGLIQTGRTQAILSLPTVDDEVQEGDGSVTAVIDASGSHGYRPGSPATATVAVRDNEGAERVPRIGILPAGSSNTSSTVAEGALATFELSGPPPSTGTPPLSVNLRIDAGGDFVAPGELGRKTATFNSEDGSLIYNVRTVHDHLEEPNGWVRLTLLSSTRYRLDPDDDSWTVTVTDDDTPVAGLVLSRPSLTVTEGGDETYTVKLATRPSAGVTVEITGHADTDLTPSPAALNFSATDWNEAQTVTVSAGEDDDTHNDTATLAHTAFGGGYAGLRADLGVTTTDNDEAPTPTVSLTVGERRRTVTEGSALTLLAEVSEAPSGRSLSIPVERAATSTAASGDYTLAASIAIADGQTYGTTILMARTDNEDEPAETLRINLGAPPEGYANGANSGVDVTIADNNPTRVTLSTPDTTATEADATATAQIRLTLNRGLVSGETLAVPLQFAGGTAGEHFKLALAGAAAGVSFTPDTSTVTFTGPTSGASATSATLKLSAYIDDNASNDVVTVSIPDRSTGNAPRLAATGLGGGVTGARSGDGRITLADAGLNLRTVGWAAQTLRVTETAAAGSLEVELSSPVSEPLTFRVCLADDTATFGTDYRGVVLGTERCTGTGATNADFTIAAGATSASVRFASIADDLDEPRETYSAVLSLPTATPGVGLDAAKETLTVTIVDDDPGHVTLSVSGVSDEAGWPANINLSLNRGLEAGEVLAVPLLFEVLHGSGITANEHFTLALAGSTAGVHVDRDTSTVVFTGPDTGATASWAQVHLFAELDDNEVNEEIRVSIPARSTGNAPRLAATGLGGGVTGSRNGNGRIILADRGLEFTRVGWAAKTLSLSETAASKSVNVVLSSVQTKSHVFRVCLIDGTATFGSDYRGVPGRADERCSGSGNRHTSGNRDVTLAAGATSASVSFAAIADDIDEPDETYTAKLLQPPPGLDGMPEIGPAILAVTVRDDDPTVVRLARDGRGAIKEGGKVAFTVSLGRALARGEVIDAPLSISGAGVTTGDWSLAPQGGAANTGVSLLATGAATATVRFAGGGARTATLELTATAGDGPEVGGETLTVALGSNAQFDADTDTNVGGGADPHDADNTFNVKVNDDETATVTAGDNDPTVVRLARDGTGVVYESGTIEFTVTLARALIDGEIIDVPLSIGGAGVTPSDWSLAEKGGAANTGVTLTGATTATPSLRFEDAGARVAALTLTATVDGVPETNGETFTVALGSNAQFDADTDTNVGGGADPHATAKTFNVTVHDGRTLGWAATTLTVTETDTGGSVNANVALSSGTGPASFRVCVENGTATFPADFLSFASKSDARCTGTSSNPDPVLSNTQSARAVALPLAADTEDEPRETYTALLSLPATTPGLSLDAAKKTLTLTVIDNDPTSVTLSARAGNVSEKGGVKTVTVRLGRALVAPEALTVTVAFGGTAASGTDYTIACRNDTSVQCGSLSGDKLPVTFTGGAGAERSTTLTLTGIEDNTDEGAETVRLALDPLTASSGTNLDGGATGSGTVEFRFNETPTAGFD